MKALVVLPTYNEADTIREVISRTLATPDVDVLVVDDGSPDGTGRIADEIASSEPRVSVLHRAEKAGLGPAYVAGFRHGMAREYALLLEMDSDLSHDPSDIGRFIAASSSHDLVIGSRYIPGGAVRNWSKAREALSRAGNFYARALLGFRLTDATGGFRCFRRAVLETIPLERVGSAGYGFQIEMAWRTWTLGFDIAEIPITFTERRAGASKMSQRIVMEALWRVLLFALKFRRRPRERHLRSVVR
ncbi:MAG: polyprenol monophosphomannose synthase [Actinomycetota bacterium]|nr:polyprenol monophosphomannose synthase [Actinomycetota bacterium]